MPIREVPQTVWERASGVPGLLAKPISLRKSKLSEEFSAPYDSDSATSEEEEEDQKEEEMYALEIEVNPINGEGMPLLVNSRSDRVLHQPAAAQRNQGRERREIVPKRHAA
ncbi:hypothetical protein GUITHDRAFT_153793 [Guillardia theta CCMP2712]|uniref:Uncharacterized protein n=2 Tax=Guillardia theta TaxID=55529 RepID=L1J0L0_GUITC|nr:hypothetical protein GUITHDRAFT_153793 [Guillardia theta CCMP2712]EKX41679.1 hypothetical protein GUITHDRAFT_153793 [Guillardia theta CCMP2712]|eukprot:XP_005828659.1 hypothetical protein GUITHDRAFT_153793 [Guillardia theta CCMP2712]